MTESKEWGMDKPLFIWRTSRGESEAGITIAVTLGIREVDGSYRYSLGIQRLLTREEITIARIDLERETERRLRAMITKRMVDMLTEGAEDE